MRVSGLKEAYFDLKQLHEEFLVQPVKPFKQFRESLESLIVAGNKMLMYDSYRQSLRFIQNLKLNLDHINRILTRLRLTEEREWAEHDLEGIKAHVIHYFDRIIKDNLKEYFAHLDPPAERTIYPFFKKFV